MSSAPAGGSGLGLGLGLAALVLAGTCVGMSVSFAPPCSTAGSNPHHPQTCRARRCAGNGSSSSRAAAASDDFDPLLSPHEYPAGIDAGAASAASTSTSTSTSSGADDNDDSFDPFLTSPHDFPSAMSSENTSPPTCSDRTSFGFDVPPPTPPTSNNGSTADDVNDDDWSPLRGAMKVEKFADDGGGSSSSISSRSKARLSSGWAVPSATSSVPADAYRQKQRAAEASAGASSSTGAGDPDADLFDVFDPRLSPHVYAEGIPECSEEEQASSTHEALSAPAPTGSQGPTTSRTKVGVLLIDHGSRRASSNDRLLELAAAYERRSPDHYVVRAAHMEIATPTIEDGIRDLVETEGVGRIVCHPYFLSPGRHVQEDIPGLVAEAIETLGVTIPIATTDPVGSSLDVMVNAIGTLVDASVREMGVDDGRGQQQQAAADDEYKLGGFFGEVQRMLDEQLD